MSIWSQKTLFSSRMGVWKEVGILDYFVPSFLGSESINCKISDFAKKVSREIKGLFGGY